VSYRQVILDSSPVAYWPFESANPVEYDLVNAVPARRIGTIVERSTKYPSAKGIDIKTNGDYYIVDAEHMAPIYWSGGSYSAEWFCHADNSNQDTIFSQRSNSDSNDQGLSFFAGTNGPGIVAVDMGPAATRKTMSSYIFQANRYMHCVYSYSSDTKVGQLYVDGVMVGSGTWVNIMPPAEVPPMHIGVLGGNGIYTWDGIIAQLSFYQRALDASEIKEHYLASGALGINVNVDGSLVRRPVKRLVGGTTKYVAIRAKS
jgi:hypothetical protein